MRKQVIQRVEVRPATYFGDFQRRVQRSIDLAATALRGRPPEGAGRPTLDVFPVWLIGSQSPDDDIKSAFGPWVKGHVLSDIFEALEPLIDGAYKSAVFGSAPASFPSEKDAQEFVMRLETPPALGRPIGEKLRVLREEFPDVLPIELYESVDPLRRLRNCLTHSAGLVRERDCDAAGELRIDGFLYELVFIADSGPVTVVGPGFVSPEAGTLGMRRRTTAIVWRAGDKVDVSESDLMCIAGTLFEFAVVLRERLYDFLESSGKLPEASRPKPPSLTIRGTLATAEPPRDQSE